MGFKKRSFKDVNLLLETVFLTEDENEEMGEENLDDINFDEEDQDQNDIPADDIEADREDMEQEDDNTVEIDVSELVNKQNDLENRFNEFEKQVKDLNLTVQTFKKKSIETLNIAKEEIQKKVEAGVQDLKDEMKKRNPTPNEKMVLQSMNSYPYNVHLSDFWKPADQNGDEYEFSISNPNQKQDQDKEEFDQQAVRSTNQEKKSLYLKMSDVFGNFSEPDVSNTF